MIGGKAQSRIRPSALGTTIQSSTYGQTIPVILGRAKSALYLIWAANLRHGSAGKKLKKIISFGKKGGTPTYVQNLDFLLGHNPIAGVLQFWENSSTRYPLNFTNYSTAYSGAMSVTVPDGEFYAVIGVTIDVVYSDVAFNDYGSPGPQTLSGTYQIPLWNAAYTGPDPTQSSAARYAPNYYFWEPGSGPTVHFPGAAGAGSAPPSGTLRIYYAQLDPAASAVYNKENGSSSAVPAAALRLTFEPVLGDGPEFAGDDSITGDPLSDQQILYPHYAGLGSPDFDLGSTQTIPDVRAEVLGSYPLYASGDCDFADMVEDICKMGLSQAALSSAYAYTQVQRGLGCYDFPGAVQNKTIVSSGSTAFAVPYDRANTAGNLLLVGNCTGSGGSAPSVSDDAGNSWTPVFSGSPTSGQLWYATALAAQSNAATVTGIGTNSQTSVLEIGGVDVLDSVVAGAGNTLSITASNAPGTPAYLLAFVNYGPKGSLGLVPNVPHWKNVVLSNDFVVLSRLVQHPGSHTLTVPGAPLQFALVAFKCSQPPGYPKPLGNILDPATLELCRAQCRANGLWGSLVMDSQQKALDWLEDLYQAMNAAPVWSGFQLKSIPYSEVSAVGNGAVYYAPTATGPVVDLQESDFIGEASDPPVTVERKAQVDVPDLLQVQHPNRASDYNDVTVSQPETGAIALYGPRKDAPKQLRCIQDVAVSRMILGIAVRRQNYLRNTYKFKLQAKRKQLEPMDLVTLPLSATLPTVAGQPATTDRIAVRLTKVAEDASFALDCEAEPFIYGCYAPKAVSVTAAQPYQAQLGADPGSVNTPIIFEPVLRLYAAQNQQQLWLVVSAAEANYGGCQVYLSTDGGASYNNVGTINGKAITGVTTADWAAAADPDTTNNLSVNLTESGGELVSYQTDDENNFVYPCYVASPAVGSPPALPAIPYELLTYAVATLTSANRYTLRATGAGHRLRRAVFGAPAGGSGVDHPSGSRFAFLGTGGTGAQPGVLKLPMDPVWIGKTLHFKFTAFNSFGGATQSQGDAVGYTYTPAGTVGSVNPGGAPSQVFQINGA